MSDLMFSPDSGLSSLSEESRQTTSSHRRKQELILLEDVDEMQTFGFGESLGVPEGIDRFLTDSLDDYVAQEEVGLSEDADNVGVLSLTDRSNKCFEEFMQIGQDSARGNELENRAGVARDALSNLLAESGIEFYSPAAAAAAAAAAAGPSGEEEELGMADLLNDAEPEPEEQTSHFVRRSQRKRSVRLEEPVEEDSEEDCTPRRKGGRSKSRRRGRSWSRRPRSQPPEERAGPSHQQQQQHHQSPLQPGTQQQFLLQQSPLLPQQQQQSQELQQQQQFQALQQQLQLPQLQLFQQFPQQQHQLSQQMAQQQQQQQFIQLQPPPMPQQQQAQQEQPQPTAPPRQLFTLPATAAVDPSNTLLSSWNLFIYNYVQKLPKELMILLDDRLNARLLGQLPPIQRKPGWLEELLQD